MWNILLRLAAIFSLVFCTMGFATIKQERDSEECKPRDSFAIGKTTKRSIVEECGLPLSTRFAGNNEILEYHDNSAKVGKAIGLSVLGGLAGGIPLGNLAGNYNKEAVYYVDILSGVVVDFYYHDYKDRKGQTPSESLLLQAGSEIDCGKIDDGLGMLKQSIALDPKNHRSLNVLAWVMLELNIDIKRALEYARRASEISPDSPYNNGTLGLAYLKNNDQENAKKYLQLALKQFEAYGPYDDKAMDHDKAYLKLLTRGGNGN